MTLLQCSLVKQHIFVPKQLVDAAFAETVATFSLTWFAQHLAAQLAAVFGLRWHDKVIFEASSRRVEALRQRHLLLPPIHAAAR